MEYLIRPAVAQDVPAMLGLIKELAEFEKEPDAVKIDEATLHKYGFGPEPIYHCFVAELDQKVIGMALVYFKFSTWNGKSLYLEDLVVTGKMRGKGIGEALLNKVVVFGKENDVQRIGWVVLDWNHGAIKFYKQKGAVIQTNWNIAQLDKEAIANFNTNS